MDNVANMVVLFVSHENKPFTLLKFDINMPKSKAANSYYHGVQSSRCAVNKNHLSWNAMTTRLIQIRFFVIHVTVLYEPSCNPDALSSILNIRLYVPIDFVHYIFFLHYFFFLPHLFSNENHLRYNMIYVAKKVVKIQGGGGRRTFLADYAQCTRTERYYQSRFSFLQLFLKLLPLVKLTNHHINDIGCKC